jgi:hypothetical protein
MNCLSLAGSPKNFGTSIATVQTPHIIGIGDFSLRVKAAFPGRKLYCALNISFHHRDLARLREHIALFGQYSLDVFIIQDLGLLDLLGEYFPHTSTQANCINCEVHRQIRLFPYSAGAQSLACRNPRNQRRSYPNWNWKSLYTALPRQCGLDKGKEVK